MADDAEAVIKLNALDASAGEYMRPTLERMEQFLNDGCVDLDACSGDTVSGTKKRESRSEAFIANPFTYTFVPVPMSDDGANFLDMPNLQFSVNKDSGNLEMANEFMHFLITSQELNKMAQNKGLLSPEVIGLTDDAVIQFRQADYGVCTGAMSIDEAVAGYGTFKQ